MGDEQDARYAARRAEIERAYTDLPAAGTPAYWQALEGAQGDALPLEVLVRCYRERMAAGVRAQADRIIELVQGRSQRPTQYWARRVAQYAPPHAQRDLEAELEQACYVELWHVMLDADQAFMLTNFRHMLECIQDHVAHKVMEQEGYWKRRGVRTPMRVPRNLTERLDRPPRDADEPDAAALPVPDPSAEEAFEQVELAADVDALLAVLSPEQRALLVDLYRRGLTQDEIAAKLGVTDRTIRNRLARIVAKLRQLWPDLGEDPHGD